MQIYKIIDWQTLCLAWNLNVIISFEGINKETREQIKSEWAAA